MARQRNARRPDRQGSHAARNASGFRQDYLADGITDNLTTEISRLAATETSSRVMARNTAFTYKRKRIGRPHSQKA
jgi:TolB-like protein